jgi:hypothetical protein
MIAQTQASEVMRESGGVIDMKAEESNGGEQ